VPWISILVVLLLVAFVAAVKYLPWWALIVIGVVIVLGWKYVAALIFAFFVRRVAREMMGALKDATIEVHDARAVPPPTRDQLEQYDRECGVDEDDDVGGADDAPELRNWFEVEFTVQCKPVAEGQDGFWNADSLSLVPVDTPSGEISDAVWRARLEFIEPERTVPRQGHTCFEPTRLKFLIGVIPSTERLACRYMVFEDLGGTINLPPPLERPALPGPNA
jgi:hypothetical protein